MVFVTSLYQLALRSYGLISTDMQKQMYSSNLKFTQWWYTYKWPHGNCFVSHMKLKWSLNDSLYSSRSISVDFKLSKPILHELTAFLQCLHKQDKRKCLKVLRRIIVADDSGPVMNVCV